MYTVYMTMVRPNTSVEFITTAQELKSDTEVVTALIESRPDLILSVNSTLSEDGLTGTRETVFASEQAATDFINLVHQIDPNYFAKRDKYIIDNGLKYLQETKIGNGNRFVVRKINWN